MDFLNRDKNYFYASIVIHCLIAISLSIPDIVNLFKSEFERAQSLPKPVRENVVIEIIPAANGSGVTYIKKEKGEGLKKDGECDHSYGGIGVYMSMDLDNFFETGYVEVTKVMYGYPAYEAGILVGDIIKEESGGLIRGEVGTDVRLIVLRNGIKYKTTITRGKICTK